MSFWKWSRTAASNATADGSINWAQGQAPLTVNDSARAMMAAASKPEWRRAQPMRLDLCQLAGFLLWPECTIR